MTQILYQDQLSALPAAVPGAATSTHLLDLALPCPLACNGCNRAQSEAALPQCAARLCTTAREASGDVRAVLYGGDPLLATESVEAFLTEAGQACGARGRRLVPLVLSSGAALTGSRARALRRAGVAGLQVSLDGTRERHDAVRPAHGGGGSWDTIVRALREEREGLPAVVRMHAVRGDPEVERLAEALEREGLFEPPQPVLLLVGPAASYRERARDLLRLHASARFPPAG